MVPMTMSATSALLPISVVQGFSPASARCASSLQPCFRIRLTRRDGFRSAHYCFMPPALFKTHDESDTHRLKSRSTHPTTQFVIGHLSLVTGHWSFVIRYLLFVIRPLLPGLFFHSMLDVGCSMLNVHLLSLPSARRSSFPESLLFPQTKPSSNEVLLPHPCSMPLATCSWKAGLR